MLNPDWNSCFCEDPARARASRRKVLAWAADQRALVIPAHLSGAHGAEVAHSGDDFAITAWAPFKETVAG